MNKKREGEMIGTFEGHEEGINCLAMAADESVLVSGSEDCTARIWDLELDEDSDLTAKEDQLDEKRNKCLGILK